MITFFSFLRGYTGNDLITNINPFLSSLGETGLKEL